MSIILIDNYKTALLEDAAAADTELVLEELAPGLADLLQNGDLGLEGITTGISSDFVVPLTIAPKGVSNPTRDEIEIVYVYGGTGINPTVTVERNRELTTAKDWTAGDAVSCNLTADAYKFSNSKEIVLGESSVGHSLYSIGIGGSAQSAANHAIAIGRMSMSRGVNAVAVGNQAVAIGPSSASFGDSASAPTERSIAIGPSAASNSDEAITIGYEASSNAVGVVTIGRSAGASGVNGIAIGLNAQVVTLQAISIGEGAFVSGSAGIAVGLNAQAVAPQAISIGEGAFVSGSTGISLGHGATNNYAQGVAIGSDTTTTDADQVHVGDRDIEVGTSTSSRGIHLYSPDGTRYKLTVDDTGTLSATADPLA